MAGRTRSPLVRARPGADGEEQERRAQLEALLDQLQSAGQARGTFAEPPAPPRKAVRLARGPASPSLIAFPAPLALCGPQQFARLAQGFRGARDTHVLTVPGFSGRERLPASLEVVIADQTGAILRAAEERPFVLAGYSTGGTLAYGMASQLERAGAPLAGVVLLDAYPITPATLVTAQLQAVLLKLFENPEWHGLLNDARLSAMGWYTHLVLDWKLEPIQAPTLLVRPSRPMPGVSSDQEWRAVWPFPHEIAEVPGDHYTMMEADAETTAEAIAIWIAARRL